MNVVAGSGKPGKEDGHGINASFYVPMGMAIDQTTGTLFVCDQNNHLIRRITSKGIRFEIVLFIT